MDPQARRQALDKLKQRHSHRQFINKRIEDEILNEILEVGLQAAGGGNLQPVSIVMVRDAARKKQLRELCKQGFIEQADTLLIFVLDYYRLKRWAEVQNAPFGRQHAFRDFIIAIEDVMCMAQSIECAANLLDIGNVYIGTVNYKYDEIKKLLNLPELTIPILMTCLGYSNDPGKGRKKLARNVVVHEEQYRTLSDEEVTKYIVNDKYDNWIQKLEGEPLAKYLAHFEQVATEFNGPEYAQEVVKRIKMQSGINRAQYRFGWHYNPTGSHQRNKIMFDFFAKQGFKFFETE